MNDYLVPMIVLGATGLLAAIILFIVARKFAVKEDERIGIVEGLLPGANCGACGRKGCHDFAVACCEAETLDGLFCPGAGTEGMQRIAEVLGLTANGKAKQIAVVRCNGSCENRIGKTDFSTVASCRLTKTMAIGENVCAWGCLGCGDCVDACNFGAVSINELTGLPEVDAKRCTGCGACATSCPKNIIELREVKAGIPMVWVGCINRDKGGVARKECRAACIGCGKCARTCPSKAISVINNVAHIDGDTCIGCGECTEGCPTRAIHSSAITVTT